MGPVHIRAYMGPVHIRAYMGPVHIGRRVLLIPSLLPGSLTEQQASIIIIINITILAIHQFETYLHRNKNIQYLFNLSTQISL